MERINATTVEQQTRGRRKWTEEMNNAILECKKKALILVNSDEAPVLENGRKKGYMRVMKELWEEMGYEYMKLSCQNLRDQSARLEKSLEKSMGDVVGNISSRVGARRERNRENQTESGNNNNSQSSQNVNAVEQETSNLHTTHTLCIQDQSTTPLGPINILSQETRELIETSANLIPLINTHPGDCSNRAIDTRIKQRPSDGDLENINKAVSELMNQSVLDPVEKPFTYLWFANCVLYAVVIAYLLYKGWKKQGVTNQSKKPNSRIEKWKKDYEEKVGETRKKISIAKAEWERLKENRKITKKGRKNRAILLEECKTISSVALVNYMEKNKSLLRKLKKGFCRRKKQEEAGCLNRQFRQEPKRVYTNMVDMLSKDELNQRPKYKNTTQNEENGERFDNIDDASSFWKKLWEERGTGNKDANWLEELESAVSRRVPPPSEENWSLEKAQAVKVLMKKRNWSAPGPDRLTNFWWKRAYSLHADVTSAFVAISKYTERYPLWFSEGKTKLTPKPGEFSSENQRPITCLNNMYKWFTSCLLKPMDHHLDDYELMEEQQRGAKIGSSGTMDNLLIDRMVTLDCHRGKRNLSMAWIDVKKAYDSVDHGWLNKMMQVHRFPGWLCGVIYNLCTSWNTKIVVNTKCGKESSGTIHFNKGLPQGDALCPRLFTLCLNPVAWKLSSTEGYRISKPISSKITSLLYIDDLKVFAASKAKLSRVLKSTKAAMEDIGLQWNPKKCNVIHIKKGAQTQDTEDLKLDQSLVIKYLKEETQYKFLGVPERLIQEEKLVLECAAKVYLQRLSIIWSSPLSDYNRVLASNQFAMPVLSYLMWTQHWPLAELRQIDRDSRKIIVESGGKHPLGSTALVYLPRDKGGRGLCSVENEYKLTKIKAGMKMYRNTDPTLQLVREFEERAVDQGHQSLVKEVLKYANEIGITVNLSHPHPTSSNNKGEMASGEKVKKQLKKAVEEQLRDKIRGEKWQGKFLKSRWDDEKLNQTGCFAWLKEWKQAPSHTIAGMMELYEQLTPTKLYTSHKTKTSQIDDVMCRLCGKAAESLAHVLAGCSALAQNKYLSRHNAALKILFFEMLKVMKLASTVPPWYSPKVPSPIYESEDAQAFWDVPIYAEYNHVTANRVDARFVDHKRKKVMAVEMSCPWINNREKKDEEKTLKYGPLRWELKQQYPGYQVEQYNVIIDVLGGWSRDLDTIMRKMLGPRGRDVLLRMQRSVISSTINIARTFKVIT